MKKKEVKIIDGFKVTKSIIEYSSNINNEYKKSSKTINIVFNSWVEVVYDDDINFTKDFERSCKSVKQYIYNNLNNELMVNNLYIVDLSIRKSGFNYKTKSFMDLDITLFTKNDIDENSVILFKHIDELIGGIIKIFKEKKYYNYHLKK